MKAKKVVGWILTVVGGIYPILLLVNAIDHLISGTLGSMTFSVPTLVVSLIVCLGGSALREGWFSKSKGE